LVTTGGENVSAEDRNPRDLVLVHSPGTPMAPGRPASSAGWRGAGPEM
jgi:hypothetical protein